MKDATNKELFPNEAVNLLLKSEKDLQRALKLINLLSNPTRLRMAFLMSKQELCVNDMERILGVDQTLISHYIRAFKNMDLTNERREGRSRFYSIDDNDIRDFFKGVKIPLH